MDDKEFISEVFELAFGDGAFPHEGDEVVLRGFSKAEVLAQLKEYIEESALAEKYGDVLFGQHGSFDAFEKAKKELLDY